MMVEAVYHNYSCLKMYTLDITSNFKVTNIMLGNREIWDIAVT